MFTKKHFIDFADFLIEEELKIIPRYNELREDIAELEKGYSSIDTFPKLYRRILEKMNKQHRELTTEIMLILDKNSLRFNKYQFKNYILAKLEKRNTTKLNKVGNMT